MSDACCGNTCGRPVGVDGPGHAGTHDHDHAASKVWQVLGSGGLILAGAATSSLGHSAIGVGVFLVAVAVSIRGPLELAFRSIRARALDINVLMVIAVAGAMALGDWLEAATVVWLFGIAQWLEVRSMGRAERAIRSLVALAPAVALVRRDGAERERPADDVVPGDVVIVRPGERLVADGIIVAGETAIDEAPITGESWPVEKGPGDPVFAGTVNGYAAFEFEASSAASDSTLANIRQLIERAQARRAPVQLFVDRFARRYTPAVVLLALAMALAMPFVVPGVDGARAAFVTWSYRALAMLVVACPCALVISTPVSIVSALTAAARHGILIKGGAHLERLGRITCVAFDKTGTLTDGAVAIADVVPVDGASADGVLALAASLESRSEHPVGRAIVGRARADGLAVVPGDGFRALPGLGAEAMVADAPAIVGSHRLFEQRGICTPSLHATVEEIEERGGTPVLVSHDGAALGVIGFTGQLRESGRHVVRTLREEGVARVVLLTGDRRRSADQARVDAGLDEAHGDLLPSDKVAHVERLRASYGPVAMVGDGVNDGPALAAADVGIAMGAAGSALALDTADVALLSDDLGKVPYALRLGRATLSNIRTNFGIALGLKLVFVVLAATGVATLWMAVLADSGASLLVTANGLRLLKVK